MSDTDRSEKKIKITGLDSISKGLTRSLEDATEGRDSFCFRVSLYRIEQYNALAEVYKKLYTKGVPKGELGDQIVDKLNDTLRMFLAERIMEKMVRGWPTILAHEGFSIDVITLECKRDNNAEFPYHELVKSIESKIDSALSRNEISSLNVESYELMRLATSLAIKYLDKIRLDALSAIADKRETWSYQQLFSYDKSAIITFQNGRYFANSIAIENKIENKSTYKKI